MNVYKNQFGLTGQSDFDYDFFIGRRKRKKAKAKKTMQKLLKSNKAPVASKSVVVQSAPRRIVRPVAPDAPVVPPASAAVSQPPVQARPTSNSQPSVATPQANDEEILNDEAQEEMAPEGESEDSFLGFGKKARQRRKLKRAEKAANIERVKAETATIKSMTAPAQGSVPAQGNASGGTSTNVAAMTEQSLPGDNAPEKSKSNMTMIIAIAGGVVVVTIGLLIMLKKPAAVPAS